MPELKDYGSYPTAWCPGCGNFGILNALKQALAESKLEPHQVAFVSGIGQAAKEPHYFNCNLFNGLHGRSIPAATGIKLANPRLTVIVDSGDGCNYGEGGNHFLHALRRNIGITVITHDNQIYALTKGQASPTSLEAMTTKAQPYGVYTRPLNPVLMAVALGAGFAARGYAGEIDHLALILKQAFLHKGFALVDVFQPCVTFNRLNTYAWYQERIYMLGEDYDPAVWENAVKKAAEFGDKIPLGVLFKQEGEPAFEERIGPLKSGPLVGRATDFQALKAVMDEYF